MKIEEIDIWIARLSSPQTVREWISIAYVIWSVNENENWVRERRVSDTLLLYILNIIKIIDWN